MTAMAGWDHDEIWLWLLDRHRVRKYVR
jgi:hypothetical protein